MAQLFASPFYTGQDNAGRPMAFARWYFYETGTLDPATVYADADLAIPLGAVVTADSAGRFPTIYLDDAQAYRAVLMEAGQPPLPIGTAIRDIDPVNPAGAEGDTSPIYSGFATVGDLLADDNDVIGYPDSGAQYIVQTGDIITAGGFRYEVASSLALDAHVTTAGGVKLYVVDDGAVTIDAFGATYTGDESALAQRMVDALNVLRVPSGRTLTAKNIELPEAARVVADGVLRLPNGCVDNDRLLNANGKGGLDIRINEIDGNAAGQSGMLGTHLIYLVGCANPKVRVHYAHDHFINAGAPMTDTRGDGRNTSTGAIWLHECHNPDVIVDRLVGWGREGLMFNKCKGGQIGLGYSLGTGDTEYSSLQANDEGILLLYAHSENAGASGVGFDVIDGRGGNIYVKNNREQNAVNMGHPGFPAHRSVLSNITVDGGWVGGIRIGSESEDVSIANFTVRDAERGLQVSDGVPDARFANGVVMGGRWNVLAGGSTVFLDGVKNEGLDPRIVQVTAAAGQFVAGETITGPSGSGVVRRVLNNLTGAKQRLHLASVSGTFAPASTVTGGTSGATGSVEYDATPLDYLEQGGGMVAGDSRVISGPAGNYTRHGDGSAEFWGKTSIVGVANTDVVQTIDFLSSMTWIAPPTVQATLSSAPSATFELTKLLAFATTSQLTVSLRTTAAQTYGIDVYARGRWAA